MYLFPEKMCKMAQNSSTFWRHLEAFSRILLETVRPSKHFGLINFKIALHLI